MAQRSLFFNDTESEQRVYFAEDEARYNYLMMAGQGIAKQGDYEAYKVEPKQNMVVTIGAGAAFIKGYLHEVYDTAEELTLDAADPTNDRIDRIVLRFINVTTEREIKLEVLKGTPSVNPVPPSVTRTNDIIELSLAQIRVIAGKSFIEPSQITDEKDDPLVCGYSPLHNLLRGVQVDENGLTTLPNQSFVKTKNDSPINLSSSLIDLPLGTIETDKQGEVIDDFTFQPKADGIYQFWVQLAWKQAAGLAGVDIQVYLYTNGTESFPLAANVFTDDNDNFVIQSGFDELQKGDSVKIKALAFRSGSLPATWFTRIRIAKMA